MTRSRILLALLALLAVTLVIVLLERSTHRTVGSGERVVTNSAIGVADREQPSRGGIAPFARRVGNPNPVVEIVTTHGVPVTDDPEAAPGIGTTVSEAATQEPKPEHDVLGESIDVYVKELIAPRVRDCWKRIPGNGQIEFRYTFRNESGTATPTVVEDANLPVTIVESSLESTQSALALDCMLDAVDGTSFSVRGIPTDPLIFKYQVWTVGTPK